MKICERCGHRNWRPGRLCHNCHEVFDQEAGCKPLIGHRVWMLEGECHRVGSHAGATPNAD